MEFPEEIESLRVEQRRRRESLDRFECRIEDLAARGRAVDALRKWL